MRRTSVSRPAGLTRFLLKGTVTLVTGLMMWSSASAVDFGNPTQGIGGSLDTTMTYGSTWRVQSPDNAIICTSNGGDARSCNYDDGTQNYDTGQVQNLFKFITELSLSYQDRFGIFTRASGFYDTEADETERTSLTADAKDKVEKSFDWLDAYAWANFDVGNMPAQVRVGRQVVNWGESTFYVTGMSSLNHFDISKLRGAAVNLREGLRPQQQIYFTISPTDNLSVEAFYQYHWSDTKPEPAATLYSTNDFATEGGKFVMLGFGAWGDLGTDFTPLGGFFDPDFQHVPRQSGNKPDDDGQYGLALRYFFPGLLGGTEFGLYYANYHSRLPVLSGFTGTQAGFGNAGGVGAASQATALALASGLSFDAAVAAGTAQGISTATSLGGDITAAELNSWATVAGNTYLQAGLDGVLALATDLGSDQFGKTAGYFSEFPEDIELYGLSWSTDIFGWSWQGEYTYKVDTPLQLDDVELLFKALSPLDNLRGTAGFCQAAGGTNPVAVGGLGCFGQQGPAYGPDNPLGIDQYIQGWRAKDVSQLQTTLTYLFDPIIGASVGAFVMETAFTKVHGFDDRSSGGPNGFGLRYDGAGTFVSGNAPLSSAHFGEVEKNTNFGSEFSWGYRLLANLTYDNLIGAWSVTPRIGWAQDVTGNTPGPGGNFIEGRETISLGVRGVLQNKWQLDLGYTKFQGAGQHNLIRDRDFIAFSASLSF
jgi:hypothetical protein